MSASPARIPAEPAPPLGAHVREGVTHFGAYVSAAETCAVRLFEGRHARTVAMDARGGGYFSCSVRDAPGGTRYLFVLDGREFPDPYARLLPDGVHAPAAVVESSYRFAHARPRIEAWAHVIYELHVGTFTAAGTYQAAATRLPELCAMGITTLELMPLAAFDGHHGWGYDGVALYAPHAAYGSPDELRAFIDAAHGLGMQVLLDVVYNHFGPAGNYLASFSEQYFNRGVQTPWGEAPRVDAPPMRRYVLDNARYWLDDFRFDGLRLDASNTIVDASRTHLIREIADIVHARTPRGLLIAEDARNDATLVRTLDCDAVWTDDFHHQLHATLTGERDGYYSAYTPGAPELAECIENGWLHDVEGLEPSGRRALAPDERPAAEHLVYCIQNHDQVGNRAFGSRLHHDIGLDAWCLASAILLFLPALPMLFMGQEWGASSPFRYFTDHEPTLGAQVAEGRRRDYARFAAFADPTVHDSIPDPQARETFERSILRWEEREHGVHREILQLYRALLAFRRDDPVMHARQERAGLQAQAFGSLLAVRRRASDGGSVRLLLGNLGATETSYDASPWYADGMTTVFARGVGEDRVLRAHGVLILAGNS